MCTFLLVWLVLAYFVSSKPGWFGCPSRPPGHRHPDCRMRMSASPVGTPPAGLVCVRDQQHVGFASTEIELLSSGSFCP